MEVGDYCSHNALYGFMIVALEGSNSDSVMDFSGLGKKNDMHLRELEVLGTAEACREREDIIGKHLKKTIY